MCHPFSIPKNPIKILEDVADVAAVATGNPELLPAINAVGGAATNKNPLLGAAEGYVTGELGATLGGADTYLGEALNSAGIPMTNAAGEGLISQATDSLGLTGENGLITQATDSLGLTGQGGLVSQAKNALGFGDTTTTSGAFNAPTLGATPTATTGGASAGLISPNSILGGANPVSTQLDSLGGGSATSTNLGSLIGGTNTATSQALNGGNLELGGGFSSAPATSTIDSAALPDTSGGTFSNLLSKTGLKSSQLLPLGSLAYQMSQGQGKLPSGAQALESGGSATSPLLTTESQNLNSWNTQTLTPAQQASVDQYTQAQTNAVLQQLASQGVQNPQQDSRYLGAIQQIQQNAESMKSQLLQGNLSAGESAGSAASSNLSNVAQLQNQQQQDYDNSLSSAINAFAYLGGKS